MAESNNTINKELDAYRRRTFRVERVLSPFFVDCSGFRKIQSITGALVSGSAALQLFDRAVYRNSDLDVYVDRDYVLDVVRFIREREHYAFQPTIAQALTPEKIIQEPEVGLYSYESNTGISNVLNFARGDQRVQLIVAKRSPLEVILGFHSSASAS